MPILSSNFKPPFGIRNPHCQTIYPTLFRKNPQLRFRSATIETQDKDFLEYDFYTSNSKKVCVLSHGLEGNSKRIYMMGMTRILLKNNWNVLAWNFRSCGKNLNRKPRLYHSGATEDLHDILSHLEQTYNFEEISLLGFSLGGNLTLKYLAEAPERVSEKITAAVAISAPCDLHASIQELNKVKNKIYTKRFLKSLKEKLKLKSEQYPDVFSLEPLKSIRNLEQFDDAYTAPIHGFKNALDYYTKSSALQFLHNLKVPSLMLSSSDDPFLSKSCLPMQLASKSKKLYLEDTSRGGHVGFASYTGDFYSEKRVSSFLNGEFF
jgi:hypothetical protein